MLKPSSTNISTKKNIHKKNVDKIKSYQHDNIIKVKYPIKIKFIIEKY